MSIHTVQLASADEKFTPPEQIIELTVLGDEMVRDESGKTWELKHARQIVFLSLSDYEETNEGTTTKRKIEFPPIYLNDLLRALASFGVGVQSFHIGEPLVRLPAPPTEERQTRRMSDRDGTARECRYCTADQVIVAEPNPDGLHACAEGHVWRDQSSRTALPLREESWVVFWRPQGRASWSRFATESSEHNGRGALATYSAQYPTAEFELHKITRTEERVDV